MTSSEISPSAVIVEPDVLGQLAYHVRCAAGLATAGEGTAAVPHAVLSWALLEAVGGDALRAAVATLDLPDDVGDIRGPGSAAVRRSTEELALQLCSHLTSSGCHRLAQLYQDAYQLLVSA